MVYQYAKHVCISKVSEAYKSSPSAGPPGSTSDTMMDVSPLSTFGLSRPPDTAIPKPILESCERKREKSLSV